MSDLMKIGPDFGGLGTFKPLTATLSGGQRVADSHGRYLTSALEGRLFSASNVGAQAVSVALATTYTGLCISNPLGNTKNLSMLGVQYALTAAPAAIASLHLIAGYSATSNVTHTTPLASPGIQSAIINGATNSTAKADSAATIVNPYYLAPLVSGFTAAALPSMSPGWIDLGGWPVIPPGGWIAIGALTAVTGFGGFLWEELPILPQS